MLPAFLPRVGYLNAQAEGPLYSAGQPAQQGSEDYLMPLKHLERFSYNLPSFSVSYHIKEISNKKKYSVSKVASCYPLKGYQGGGGRAPSAAVWFQIIPLWRLYTRKQKALCTPGHPGEPAQGNSAVSPLGGKRILPSCLLVLPSLFLLPQLVSS